MHGSVLQNDKYIEFSNDNSVEVIALGRLQEGIDKNDPKAATYDAKDEKGNPVKYLMEYPGMTVEEMLNLDRSPAGQYNDTGKIPFTAIVDPHTLKRMQGMPGGLSAKGLMEKVEFAKEQLEKDHGPSMKRSSLRKFEQGAKDVEALLEKAGVAKALESFRKLKGSVAKEPEALKAKAAALETKLLDIVRTKLDEAESMIGLGDMKGAKAILSPLGSVLKGTELEGRVKELLEKTKAPEPAPAK